MSLPRFTARFTSRLKRSDGARRSVIPGRGDIDSLARHYARLLELRGPGAWGARRCGERCAQRRSMGISMVPSLGRASLLAPSPLFVWDFNTKATKNTKKKKHYYFQIVIRATTFVSFVLKSKGRARQMAGRERRGSKAVAFGAVKTRFGLGRTQWPQAGEEIAASVNFNAGWYYRPRSFIISAVLA